MTSVPVLAAEGVTKRYSGAVGVDALRGVDVEVRVGEVVALEGPSGSGKSTLLGLLGLLDVPSGGVVRVSGRDAGSLGDAARTRLRADLFGFVFQQFNLVGHLSALANVEMAILYRGLSPRRRRARALAELERVGLAERAGHRPGKLSGGEQQRVALARAVVAGPKVVLADEPTGNLDSVSAGVVLDVLSGFAAEGVAVVIVTHDRSVAERADRRVRLRDGVVVS